ncbi:hypothetical protein ACFO4L_01770 [Bacillus daqingensis]|uniref:Uncharacterized protein n=1 Tax=Bacillus daqingensis TaxID=872396 RepID=A0ABV9NSY7_9BACI
MRLLWILGTWLSAAFVLTLILEQAGSAIQHERVLLTLATAAAGLFCYTKWSRSQLMRDLAWLTLAVIGFVSAVTLIGMLPAP